MRKLLLPLSLLLFITGFSVSAENILTLTNPKTRETEVFRPGSFMVFELKNDHTVREGYIREIGDSSIRFEGQSYESQVSLSEINILAGTTKAKVTASRVASAVGDALVVAGLTVFDCGIDFFTYGDYYYWPVGCSVWLAGAFIAGVGYAFDFAAHPFSQSVRVRNYRDWEAQIYDEDLPQTTQERVVQPSEPEKTTAPPAQEEPGKEKNKKNRSGDDVYGD